MERNEGQNLLPCPKCGDNCIVRVKKIDSVDGDPQFRVVCDECGFSLGDKATKEEAVEDWNIMVEGSKPYRFSSLVVALFKRNAHCREVEKCCANCRYGDVGYEGEVDCEHPNLEYSDEYGDKRMASHCTTDSTVCDLWEKREQEG